MSKNNRHGDSMPFSVSQNFFTSRATIKRLLRITSIGKEDRVVEIGAGKGHITKELVKICREVTAFEIDKELIEYLRKNFREFENLRILHQDFLKYSMPKGKYKVFSNMPFSLTSQIMRKLVLADNPPTEAWLFMEKGAAKRFLGSPNESLTSIYIKPFFELEIKYYFLRSDFHPMPSVDIVLVHLAKRISPDIPFEQQKSFIRFVKRGLKYGINCELTKRQAAAALRLAGLPGIKQSGTMLYVQWLCLFRCYYRFYGNK